MGGSASLFIDHHGLQLIGNGGRFIRHPYGTVHQDAERGHTGGRAYERAMWTHRWQSASYDIVPSTTSWPPKCPQEGRTLAPRCLQDVVRATHRKGLDIDSCRRRCHRRRRRSSLSSSLRFRRFLLLILLLLHITFIRKPMRGRMRFTAALHAATHP